MIMKAQVVELVGSNLFRVRIPTLNGKEGDTTSTPNEDLPLATLCTLPNISNVVNAGDIVFVEFEENDYGRPVILGQLYRPQASTNNNTCVDLRVRSIEVNDKRGGMSTSRATLPYNTTIGTRSFDDMSKLLFWFDNMNNH